MHPTHLGPYKIDKLLGKGGMGSVYAATDQKTGERVAIKALAPHLATAEGFRERFEAEIESLKTLRHEGIVRLFGYGEQDGVLFYSMELINGPSLEDEMRAGRRFHWREVTTIAIQLALALKHAHDHGIVHRDIKPANILLASAKTNSTDTQPASHLSLHDDYRVKLADFGIARLFGMTQLTTAGGVLGTADYMSPEQAEGRPVTPRCDQYSLGGVMYALLAGRPPFRAQNFPQMLQLQRFAQPEPVRRYAPDTPEQLEQVILQLLAKDPADRFPNTQVLARHLQAMVRALSRPAPDDFSLAGQAPTARPPESDVEDPLEMVPTRAEQPAAAKPEGITTGIDPSQQLATTQSAPTLLAQSDSSKRGLTAKPVATALADRESPMLEAPSRAARFTTVEEDEARRRAEHRRSWLQVLAQLAGLLVLLAITIAVVVFLSRPRTADELYHIVSSRVENEEDLASVAKEIEEFLTRYPNDPRATELQRYQEQIELSKLERRLHRQSRGSGANGSVSPVERLYLQAISTAESSPETAVAMLQSLVDLYRPTASDEANSDAVVIVQLAMRRLAVLKADLANQHQQQLASLRERLEAAEKIAQQTPEQAAAMYQAIIQLHQDDEWAAQVVDEARSRLAELEGKSP
jgi:serine/threonine-protein kinase